MKKSKIYTRTGDKGTTSLVGGTRVPKNHIRLNAYGTIDELNSFLGLLRSQLTDDDDKKNIFIIQNELFLVGGALASENPQQMKSCITPVNIERIEKQIDIIDSELPPLHNFVIPSDFQPAAICHVCRSVCRRAERAIYDLSEVTLIEDLIFSYVNRLSDYFFVLSRKITVTHYKEDFFSDNTCR